MYIIPQAKAAGPNAVCLSGTQMLAILDAIEDYRELAAQCGDDEADWPALLRAREAHKAAFKE
jgi:hypothetical protein